MLYKFNDIFGKTLTINLNESNLFEMKSKEVSFNNDLLNLTANSIINFYFNYRLRPKFSSVVSAKLKFNITNGDAIFNINNEYSMVSFTNRIIDTFKFSEKVDIDLVNYFSTDGGFYFSLNSKSEFSINKDSICLEFSYISLEESIVNQEYLIKSFSDFSYRLNIRNGKVNYYYNLLNISNSSFNVDLKLIYDLDFNSAPVNSMPLGFKFNFCETVWYNFDDNTYFYEDKNGDKHVFIKSKNDDNAYVDVAGTYFVLYIYNDRYEILNDNIRRIFDKNGYLTKITKKVFMDGYINIFSLILSYDSNYNQI